MFFCVVQTIKYAVVAQLVEHDIGNIEVIGSIPINGSHMNRKKILLFLFFAVFTCSAIFVFIYIKKEKGNPEFAFPGFGQSKLISLREENKLYIDRNGKYQIILIIMI